ncbi:MAG: WD40 repeat domain-containing protein [Microcoleaceae cyanobacterium]
MKLSKTSTINLVVGLIFALPVFLVLLGTVKKPYSDTLKYDFKQFAEDTSLSEKLTSQSIEVNAIDITPDNQKVVIGGSKGVIGIYQLNTGKLLQSLSGQNGENNISAVKVSPDGQKLIAGSDKGKLIIWNLRNSKKLAEVSNDNHGVLSISISSDGTKAAIGYDNKRVKILTLETSETESLKQFTLKPLLGHSSRVNGVSISSDNGKIVSGSDDKTMRVWDVSSQAEIHQNKDEEEVFSVAFIPRSETIIGGLGNGRLKVWNPIQETEIETSTESYSKEKHGQKVSSLAFSEIRNLLVSASNDGSIKVWQVNPLRHVQELKKHTNYVSSVDISPDGKTIISGSRDQTIKVWKAQE